MVMERRIANPEDYIDEGDYNPHNVRAHRIGNEYGELAIAYASNPQDALDIAMDAGLLKGLQVAERYGDPEFEQLVEWGEIAFAGDYGNPYDAVSLWIDDMCDNKSPEEFTLS